MNHDMFGLIYWHLLFKYAVLLARNDAVDKELIIVPYVLWFTAKGGSVF